MTFFPVGPSALWVALLWDAPRFMSGGAIRTHMRFSEKARSKVSCASQAFRLSNHAFRKRTTSIGSPALSLASRICSTAFFRSASSGIGALPANRDPARSPRQRSNARGGLEIRPPLPCALCAHGPRPAWPQPGARRASAVGQRYPVGEKMHLGGIGRHMDLAAAHLGVDAVQLGDHLIVLVALLAEIE